MVDAQDESNNGQSEDLESVLPDMDPDSSANSTLSNFSLPTISSSDDVVSDNNNFTQNNTTEPLITDENVTPSEENTTVSEEPPVSDENVTPPEENTTVSEEPPVSDENVTPPEENTTVSEENTTISEPHNPYILPSQT